MGKQVKISSETAEILVQRVADMLAGQSNKNGRILVAIDGRCASGKTTLAAGLKKKLSCEVVHMDHFFLRPEQRTQERLSMPGENVDHERFLQEVLQPLESGEPVAYCPFDCKTMALGRPVSLEERKIYVIEGAYACHPSLKEYYDLCIFMDVDKEEQMRRIVIRNGEGTAEVFASKWIPLEEHYFETFAVADGCDYIIKT